jgi:hypothetical protein
MNSRDILRRGDDSVGDSGGNTGSSPDVPCGVAGLPAFRTLDQKYWECLSISGWVEAFRGAKGKPAEWESGPHKRRYIYIYTLLYLR